VGSSWAAWRLRLPGRLLLLAAVTTTSHEQHGQPFTCQGQLDDNGRAANANGAHDLRFQLFPTASVVR